MTFSDTPKKLFLFALNVLIICLTSTSSYAMNLSEAEKPASEKEIMLCQNLSKKAGLWRQCLSQESDLNSKSEACHEAHFLYTNQPADGTFATHFDMYEGSFLIWMENAKLQFYDRFQQYPIKVLISLGLWAIDGIVLFARPELWPLATVAGTAISFYMWGTEGLHLLTPCAGINPKTDPDKLKRCVHTIKDELKNQSQSQVQSQASKINASYFERVRQSENGLPFRFTCASLERFVMHQEFRFTQMK